MSGVRRIIYFTDDQFKRLQWLAKQTGESVSTVVRVGFEEYWNKLKERESLRSHLKKEKWKTPSLNSLTSLPKKQIRKRKKEI